MDPLRDFFSFSQRERNGILFLIALIVAMLLWLLLAPKFFYSTKSEDQSVIDSVLNAAVFLKSDTLVENTSTKENDTLSLSSRFNIKRFAFDPNTINRDSALMLGFSSWQFNTLTNYRTKGGKFFKKEDLKKIYGIRTGQYDSLQELIVIADSKNSFHKITPPPTSTLKVDINSADSASLVLLKGIGPAFASRIIKFRNKLGGFYSADQLYEVYGMDSSRVVLLLSQINFNTPITKININNASVLELKSHPYLSYNEANAIVSYREKHGQYRSANDLMNVKSLNEKTIKKINPYLQF